MSNRNKQGFFGAMAIIQIVTNVLCWFNVNDYAKEYLKAFKEGFETAGAEVSGQLEKLFTMQFATNYVIFASGLCALIGVALFIMAANENLVRKKGLSIFLLILMILFTLSDLATNISIIGITILNVIPTTTIKVVGLFWGIS